MELTSIFFSDNAIFSQIPDYNQFEHHKQNLLVVSERLAKAFILTDQYKRQLTIINSCPSLSNIFSSTSPEQAVNEEEFLNKIPSEFLPTFGLYTSVINKYISAHTSEVENSFYFSFRAPLTTANDQIQMVELKVFPYIYSDFTKERVPWVNFYQCDPCTAPNAGQLTLHSLNENMKTFYLFDYLQNNEPDYITLKQEDLEIFVLASQGFSETEITDQLNISTSTLKRIKSTIMTHINAQSTAQTIAILYKQGLI